MTKSTKKTVSKTPRDFHQEVTNQIIEALEAGVKPWSCPWDVTQSDGLPYNFSTGNTYSGMNVMLLWMSAQMNQFSSNQWLTFKQALDLGGNVIKGEKGTHITFYKSLEKEKTVNGKEKIETIPMLKTFVVFNLDQIEGITKPEPKTDLIGELDLREDVEDFFKATGATINYVGQKAFFRPSTDEIVIPERERFESTANLYATVMHELTHWTGHKSRLNRTKGSKFGDKDYAFEELVAELGSAFLMADFGIVGDVQHESYIANWLEVLKNDKRFIFKAASQASKAFTHLKEYVEDESENQLKAA
ncbi:ArdC family protein [uncultured Vibrio sp.]|nr:zincin-like metallopeptidase domain-containing protein [uncultured Vibrio sp.]